MTVTTLSPRRASRRKVITGSVIRELQVQGPQPSRAEKAVARVLAQLQAIGLKPADLSTMLNADIRTIYRWEKGQGLGRLVHVQRLLDLGEIMDLAQKAHGKHYLDWFWMPNPLLGNVQPATLLKDPANGPELVKQVLFNSLTGGVA